MARIWRWLAAGGIAAVVFAAETIQAQTAGAGFWLVGLPESGETCVVQHISQNGDVVGGTVEISKPKYRAGSFRWSAVGGRDDWGLMPGMPDVNGAFSCDISGQIVAGMMSWGTSATERAFRCVGSGPLEDLGVLPGLVRSYGGGISGDGSVVVGVCRNADGQFGRAFRWTKPGGMQDLGALTVQSPFSEAQAISRDGTTIVGININEVLWYQAFTWRQGEGMKALPKLPGTGWDSTAKAVNADGTVIVGSAANLSGASKAARWTPAGVEELSSGLGLFSLAFAVSDDGGVVGGSYQDGGESFAFFWTEATGMLNGPDFLALHGLSVPAGYKLEYVYAISGDGRTFGGMARNLATNQKEGWVAKVPGPSTCTPDCDGSAKLDIDDFICFQTYFALGDTKADCDASGGLDIDDFICFQTFFSLGC